MSNLTCNKICTGKAGYWNCVCAPFVLLWNSLTIFCFPCIGVYFARCCFRLKVSLKSCKDRTINPTTLPPHGLA